MAKRYNPNENNAAAAAALTDQGALIPPQAIELEEAVLGALMLEKDAIIEIQGVLTPEAFYKEAHQTIYKAIMDLSMELKPIDLYTVSEKLRQTRKLTSVGGASYLAQLTQKVGSAAHIEFHSKIIAQKYVQRELIRAATEIQKKAYDESMDVTDLIDLAEGEIFKVSEGHVKRDVQKSRDIITKTLQVIEEASKREGGFSGVPTGFTHLDRLTLGWQPSDLIIIAARPSMGKTAFVLSLARNVAVDFEKGVAFFSLEMSAEQLMMRLIVGESGLDSRDVRNGQLTPDQWKHLETSIKPLAAAPLFIDDTPALSIYEFRSKARRLKTQYDIQLVIIDYLQLMTAQTDSRGEPRTGSGDDLAIAEGDRQGAQHPDHRPLAAQPVGRVAGRQQASAALGPARIGSHRAGRRPGSVHPPPRILRADRGRGRRAHAGHGRDHRREAP